MQMYNLFRIRYITIKSISTLLLLNKPCSRNVPELISAPYAQA